MGCRRSLKVHILDAHPDKFKKNIGASSEEQGKRFHQDILDFEHRYQGQKHDGGLHLEAYSISDLQYTHKSRKTTHFQTFLSHF